MKESYRRTPYVGILGDLKALEPRFARRAAQGWMIDKIGLFTHRYRAIAPAEMRFFVDLLPQITAFDYPDNEAAQDYRALCEQSGWTFVAASKQIHVFCADDSATPPLPIHTDNRLQAQIYLKASRKYELFPYLLTTLMLVFSLWAQLSLGAGALLSNLVLFSLAGLSLFLVGYVWMLGHLLLWHLRTWQAAKRDAPMPRAGTRMSRLREAVFIVSACLCFLSQAIGVVLQLADGASLGVLAVLLLPLLAAGVGVWLRRQIETKRRTRGANIRLFVAALVLMELVLFALMGFAIWGVITAAPRSDALAGRPVLTLYDVGETAPPRVEHTQTGSSVAVPTQYSHWEIGDGAGTFTHVYRAAVAPLAQTLYRYYTADLLQLHPSAVPLTSDEAAFWGAQQGIGVVTAGGDGAQLLLLRDHVVLRLSFDGENMRPETVAAAVARLW